MKNNIKTVCGIEKYDELSKRKGFLNQLRFYWFVLSASLRDIGKKENDKGRINLVSELFYTPRGDSSTISPQSFPLINFHQAINTNIINNSGFMIEDANFRKFEKYKD